LEELNLEKLGFEIEE